VLLILYIYILYLFAEQFLWLLIQIWFLLSRCLSLLFLQHIVKRLSDYTRDFIWWLGLLTTYRSNIYVTIALSLILTICGLLKHVLSFLSLLCLHQSLSGNSFQWWTFPLLWVAELLPRLRCQLLTATAHNDWTSVLTGTHLPTSSLLSCTSLNWTELHCTNCPSYNI
jgi:hypothetical protein